MTSSAREPKKLDSIDFIPETVPLVINWWAFLTFFFYGKREFNDSVIHEWFFWEKKLSKEILMVSFICMKFSVDFVDFELLGLL